MKLEEIFGITREEIEEVLKIKMGGATRNVLELHYGLNGKTAHTLEEIANELGISMEKVREIEVKAIGLLKQRKNK